MGELIYKKTIIKPDEAGRDESGAEIRLYGMRKDSREVFNNWFPIFLEDPSVKGTVLLATDTVKSRAIEKAVKIANYSVGHILETAEAIKDKSF